MRRLQVRSSGYVLIAFILTSRSAFCDVVAHWRFQDGIGGKPAESARLIRDSSGNDRHGHVLGRPKYRSVDMPGSNLGLAFDGVDDRIHIPDHELFYLSDSLTIEA